MIEPCYEIFANQHNRLNLFRMAVLESYIFFTRQFLANNLPKIDK